MNVLIEPHYLPSLEYMCLLAAAETVTLDHHAHFEKQTYRNRFYINTAQGVKLLSVPLENRRGKMMMNEVKVDPGKGWRNIHWRTLESAYRSSPFYEYYAEDLKKIIYHGHEFLVDLNQDLLSFCLKQTKLRITVASSSRYVDQPNEGEIDLRNVLSDRKPFALREFYVSVPYTQVFGNEFVPNLSLVDLLFCTGPEAPMILRASRGKMNI